MDNREMFEWLREEMKGLRSDVGEMKVTLTSQAASIEHHIKRTDLLEARIEQVAAPIQNLRGVWWILKGLGATAAAVAAIVGLWNMLH